MSRAANSLKTSDVITTPIKLKYSSSYESASLASNGIQVLKGVNGSVTITGSVPQTTLNYRSIRHLYYSNYLTGSYLVSASSADNYLQSTAASGTFDADVRYFPTESGAEITIFSIPRSIYGQQISRKSFILSSSQYCIVDDGNGNLIDISTGSFAYIVAGYFDAETYFESSAATGSIPVGNIIYPQGMVIITAPAYQAYFTATTPPPPPPAPPIEDVLTLEEFGGQAYYKRFDDGLTYTALGNGTTQITYTGNDIDFTTEDLNKSFCGLFANRNPDFVDYTRVDEYYPGIVGSRYSKVIQVIDTKNIVVDFEYNLNIQNGKGYVFFDNSEAWNNLLDAYINVSPKSKILLKEYLNPKDVYVIPQFSTKRMPTDKEFQISTFTSNHARVKIGLEDYFQWTGSGRNNTNFTRIYEQPQFMFDPAVSNFNWISHNVYWLPPHRRYAEAQSFSFQFFGTLGLIGNQARIIAIVNNKALEEEREMQGKITSETFTSTGIGFVYAGGTYTGNGSSINDEVQDFMYLLTKDYEHRGQGFMDLKANDGGGLYFVAENATTDYIPEGEFNPTYFYCDSKFTTNYDGLDPAIQTKTYFPEYIFEITDGNSWYQVNNLFWNEGWGNGSNIVQIDRFAFWVPKPAWWKNIYVKWYNRGQGIPNWSTEGYDVFSGKKLMLNHIARAGQTYTFGRHYTTDRIENAPIKDLIPNQIRSSINWSLILEKTIDNIDPVNDIPANCFPMELQPGDQFTIVGYGSEVWTVTENNRGVFPNWPDEITFWNGFNTNYSELAYNFTVHTLDKNLPVDLPPTFELTIVVSNAEGLLDGTVRNSLAVYKSNLPATTTVSSTLGSGNILWSNPFGHVTYNHQEITLWAKNFDHNGFYRQSNNAWPTNFTIVDPDTSNNIQVGPLRKYSKGYTMINCDGFVGEFSPQGQFATRDKIRISQGINLPEDQKEMLRMYNCTNMNGLENSTDPYVKNFVDPNLAPDMPQPCRDLLNSLP